MKEITLSKREIYDLLKKHKCPSCGSYDVIFYNPNLMDDDEIQTEFECQNCPCYTVIVSKSEKFFDNRL
jgi:DNA-directed RNA polymerase subunit M/transcription elongation factor TFIIS